MPEQFAQEVESLRNGDEDVCVLLWIYKPDFRARRGRVYRLETIPEISLSQFSQTAAFFSFRASRLAAKRDLSRGPPSEPAACALGRSNPASAAARAIFGKLIEQRNQQIAGAAAIVSRDHAFQEAFAGADTDRATTLSALESLQGRVKADVVLIASLEKKLLFDTRRPAIARRRISVSEVDR